MGCLHATCIFDSENYFCGHSHFGFHVPLFPIDDSVHVPQFRYDVLLLSEAPHSAQQDETRIFQRSDDTDYLLPLVLDE